MVARLIALVLVVTATASALASFRPPAIPLITQDPFMQTWMRGDNSTAASVTHWAGEIEKQMVGLLKIDGNTFSYLGESSSPALTQRSVQALPTRTVFELELPGVVSLNVTFLSTMFTDDYVRLSRPVYYLILDTASLDGHKHEVAAYFDISAQHVVNSCKDQQVQWKSWKSASATAGMMTGIQIGNLAQKILGSKGDRVNIDWGWLHLGAVPNSEKATTALFAGSATTARAQFAASGKLPGKPDTRMPRMCGDDLPALATSHEFGPELGRHTIMLGYDDVRSVFYFGDEFRGLWTQTYSSIMDAMGAAAVEVDAMLAKSTAHDAALMKALTAKAGPKYAALCALAYRQTLAATKLVWNHKKNTTWNFLKEISTNGDMQTMDVIYPGSPMLLYTNPDLLKLLLIPVLNYAHNDTYIKFGNPYSPHQLGTYPIANDTTARQEPMPLENSGNMLFMLLAIARRMPDIQWLQPYFAMLSSWADELVRTTEFPANQICTDDFTGPLANNTNLGAKGIISLEVFAEICHLMVKGGGAGARVTAANCDDYSTTAAKYAKTWMAYAHTDSPAPHFKMSYNDLKGIDDSWSIKYNLLWQKLLGLKGPFPWNEVVPKEVAYYLSKANPYGIPMDPRHAYVKTDWLSWAAAMTSTDKDFHMIMDPIYKFADETPSRNPFTDLYDTQTGKQQGPAFIARPVIGGIFAKMLMADDA